MSNNIDKSKKKDKKSVILLILILIFAAVFVYSGIRLGKILYNYAHNAKVQREVKDMFFTDASDTADEPGETEESSKVITDENLPVNNEGAGGVRKPKLPHYDFTKLLELNPDVQGWLLIPVAEVNHPVVQSYNNDVYLHMNIYGDIEYAGTMFMDWRSEWGESRNCVIYGHSMADGSMMGKLRRLLSQENADQNPVFWYIMPDAVYECQIFSTYRTTVFEDYLRLDFESDEDFLNYIEEMRSLSEAVFPDVEITAEDKILTLSTCNYSENYETGRQALYAKIVKVE